MNYLKKTFSKKCQFFYELLKKIFPKNANFL